MSSRDYELEQGRRPDEARPAAQPAPLTPAQELASAIGNQGMTRLAREGAGILPDGRAHPQVEAEIAATRGAGQRLDDGARETLGTGLGDSLEDVRVHTDDRAEALATSVAARAFTTGSDVYFRQGEYDPGSSAGRELLAHELTHVVQQRGASATGPLEVSQPGDALEHEAEAAANELTG